MSAVKALAIAASEGQKIFTITPANAATALPKLTIGGDMRWEIESAVQAGREVTVHERPINAHGYSGYGYMIVDPETGAGAYLIEGKGNGAFILGAYAGAMIAMELLMLGFVPTSAPAVYEAAVTVILPYLVFCAAFLGTLAITYGGADKLLGCFNSGLAAVITTVLIPGGPGTKALEWVDYLMDMLGWTFYSPPTARECGVL